jgi:hypothetical protein
MIVKDEQKSKKIRVKYKFKGKELIAKKNAKKIMANRTHPKMNLKNQL